MPLAPGAELQVVATTSIVGDVVGRIGGDAVVLTTLMGLGADPHTYVARPSDSAAVHDAHVLFSNGAGLEEGMSELILDSSGGAVHVSLSDSLPLLVAAHGGGAQQPGTGEAAGQPDPHVWFDVQNILAWTTTVLETLSALDPAHRSSYQANADAYTQELEDLDAWVLEQVAIVPQANRKLVTNHETLGYFARRYGFELVGAVYPLSPSSEPSARDLAGLEEAIRQYGLSVLFTEGTVSPVLADQVARDTGVRLVPLYTESLGPPGSGAESYIAMIRYDVQAIVAALTSVPGLE
jgi:ABC-type Zn uptake system ZnuABC Zn-binding protein ZnuA